MHRNSCKYPMSDAGRVTRTRRLSMAAPNCAEARELWRASADRFAACKLVQHPEKTKIVYCKDANRRGDFPVIAFDFTRLWTRGLPAFRTWGTVAM